jgi:hypothetical protein
VNFTFVQVGFAAVMGRGSAAAAAIMIKTAQLRLSSSGEWQAAKQQQEVRVERAGRRVGPEIGPASTCFFMAVSLLGCMAQLASFGPA